MGRGELCFRTTSRLNQCFPPWAVTVGAVLRFSGRCLYLDLWDTGDHPLGELQALMVNVENLSLWAREEGYFQLSLPRQWHWGLTSYALWPDLLGVAPVPSGPPIQSGGSSGAFPQEGLGVVGGRGMEEGCWAPGWGVQWRFCPPGGAGPAPAGPPNRGNAVSLIVCGKQHPSIMSGSQD